METLKGERPFTVFDPTGPAFAKTSEKVLNALLADKDKLSEILIFHVIPGKVVAANVRSGLFKTVQGLAVNVITSSMGAKVNDGKVTKTDAKATTCGFIYVVDTVSMPK